MDIEPGHKYKVVVHLPDYDVEYRTELKNLRLVREFAEKIAEMNDWSVYRTPTLYSKIMGWTKIHFGL